MHSYYFNDFVSRVELVLKVIGWGDLPNGIDGTCTYLGLFPWSVWSIYLYERSMCRYARLNVLSALHVHGPHFNGPLHLVAEEMAQNLDWPCPTDT